MLLTLAIALNIWTWSLVILKYTMVCLKDIHWFIILILFTLSLAFTVMVHIGQWKCWNYLRHRPQRLRSIQHLPMNIMPTIVLLIVMWLETITFVVVVYLCRPFPWLLSLFAFIPIIIYTATTASLESSSPESLESPSESSNVNASLSTLDSSSKVGLESSEI